MALARRDRLDYLEFLETILADEVLRRDRKRLAVRLQKAGFEQLRALEDFDWDAAITLDRRLIDVIFSLDFIDRKEHVLFVGPVGVGKSFLALDPGLCGDQGRSLGKVRQGRSVL